MKLTLHPNLVPDHIDGFLIQSDFQVSRFSARGFGSEKGTSRHAEHSREELELNLAVHGRADYLIAEQRVTVDAGHLLFIRPRQNRLVLDASPNFSAWVLVCRARLVRRVCTAAPSRPLRANGGTEVLLRRLPEKDVRELAALYAGVPVGSGRDAFNAGLAYALARSWVSYSRATGAELPAEVHPAVHKAAWLLRDSPEHLDNGELAARSGLSPGRLSRLFKEQLGVPLAEFRNRQRLDHFLAALERDGDPNLLDAAFGAGFGSYAQFHRVFKARMGASPAEYVRNRKRLDPGRVLEQLARGHVSRKGATSPVSR